MLVYIFSIFIWILIELFYVFNYFYYIYFLHQFIQILLNYPLSIIVNTIPWDQYFLISVESNNLIFDYSIF